MFVTLLAAFALLPQSTPPKPAPVVEPLTLTGCVSGKPDRGNYTFTDAAGGNRYRLTGKDIPITLLKVKVDDIKMIAANCNQ